MENGYRNGGFSDQKWSRSILILVYQRVRLISYTSFVNKSGILTQIIQDVSLFPMRIAIDPMVYPHFPTKMVPFLLKIIIFSLTILIFPMENPHFPMENPPFSRPCPPSTPSARSQGLLVFNSSQRLYGRGAGPPDALRLLAEGSPVTLAPRRDL